MKQKYFAKEVNEATESFMRFWEDLQRSEMLISYLEVGSKFINLNKEEAKQAFYDIYNNPANPEDAKKVLDNSADIFLDIKFYDEHLAALIYVRTIDNFTSYFKEVLSEIILQKPQILKSKEPESLEFILSYESIDELRKAIADKKIEELFYKGIEHIEKFFKDRLKVDIFKNVNEKNNISLLIKLRNLTVHNRRQIPKDFAKQFSQPYYKAGEYIIFDFRYVSSVNFGLFNFVATLDEEISNKFKLKLHKRRQ